MMVNHFNTDGKEEDGEATAQGHLTLGLVIFTEKCA